ncbi:MAG: ABC transporter permease subunit [Phycisphaerae bacterium]|nr:ABC transporter permease subunit [Phycisphaerae bacterium]
MKVTAIADNTFREGVRQPVYLLVLVLVAALLVTHFFLPYFTLGQDILMFKDVCLAYILMGLLVTALLLASKVVDEEIENKTTLTLMSKPVRRWELILGKFVGVMYAVTLMLAILAALMVLLTYLRAPEDISTHMDPFDEEQISRVAGARKLHVLSLLPAFVLIWLQIAVMASISVAISTRVGMVLNMVIGVALFVVFHLTPFVAERGGRAARAMTVLLANLESLNLNGLLIYKNLHFGPGPLGHGEVAYAEVWRLVGLAGGYAGAYVAAALLIAMALFRTRELG